MQKQEMILETETDLSVAADEFLEAKKNLKLSKDLFVTAEEKLIEVMNEHKKYKLLHGNFLLKIKEGKATREKINVGEII